MTKEVSAFVVTLIAIMAVSAFGANRAPDFSVSAHVLNGRLILRAKPPKVHHFNLQAPKFLENLSSHQRYKPKTEKLHLLAFVLRGLQTRTLLLSAYLCDNAKTYCELHRVTVKWNGHSLSGHSSSEPHRNQVSSKVHAETTNSHLKIDDAGFIENNPRAAMAQAARENRPLMIDFYGIWCPPCNMLNEEVFASKRFQSIASRWVKLKLDADATVSWKLKSRYHIGGYPTVILADSHGNEISRIVGFRPLGQILTRIKSAWKNRKIAFNDVKKRADHGDAVACAKVGHIYLERAQYALALHYLKKSSDHEATARARIGLAQNRNSGEAAAMQSYIRGFPQNPEVLDYGSQLADFYKSHKAAPKRKAALKDVVKSARWFLKHPEKLRGHDWQPADVLEVLADSLGQLRQKTESQKTWGQAAALYLAQIKSLKGANPKTERGNNLERAYCLWNAGKIKQADALYESLQNRYPKEFTFYYEHGYMCYQLKRLTRAERLARRALLYSYGDNRLRAVHLLAEVYGAQGQKAKGLQLIRRTLEAASLPKDKTIRTHRYYKLLVKLEKKLKG